MYEVLAQLEIGSSHNNTCCYVAVELFCPMIIFNTDERLSFRSAPGTRQVRPWNLFPCHQCDPDGLKVCVYKTACAYGRLHKYLAVTSEFAAFVLPRRDAAARFRVMFSLQIGIDH